MIVNLLENMWWIFVVLLAAPAGGVHHQYTTLNQDTLVRASAAPRLSPPALVIPDPAVAELPGDGYLVGFNAVLSGSEGTFRLVRLQKETGTPTTYSIEAKSADINVNATSVLQPYYFEEYQGFSFQNGDVIAVELVDGTPLGESEDVTCDWSESPTLLAPEYLPLGATNVSLDYFYDTAAGQVSTEPACFLLGLDPIVLYDTNAWQASCDATDFTFADGTLVSTYKTSDQLGISASSFSDVSACQLYTHAQSGGGFQVTVTDFVGGSGGNCDSEYLEIRKGPSLGNSRAVRTLCGGETADEVSVAAASQGVIIYYWAGQSAGANRGSFSFTVQAFKNFSEIGVGTDPGSAVPEGGLSGGVIAGIVIGSIIGVVLLLVLCGVCCYLCNKADKKSSSPAPTNNTVSWRSNVVHTSDSPTGKQTAPCSQPAATAGAPVPPPYGGGQGTTTTPTAPPPNRLPPLIGHQPQQNPPVPPPAYSSLDQGHGTFGAPQSSYPPVHSEQMAQGEPVHGHALLVAPAQSYPPPASSNELPQQPGDVGDISGGAVPGPATYKY